MLATASRSAPADIFDYVVIGGGAAASVLAHRLSEDGRSTVCVLEAGPHRRTNRWINLPAGTVKNLFNERVSYQIDCEPSWGTAGRRIRLATGKTTGGSGAINGMVYFRGQAADFDGWAQMGATGWSFSDVLPYFRLSEKRDGGDPTYRSRDGWLPVTDSNWQAPVCDGFARAAAEAGFAVNADYNGASQDGLFTYQAFIEKGRRADAGRMLLEKAEHRSNVDLRTQASVERILFDGTRATGILYRGSGGTSIRIDARKAVILSAGAIHSPKLLQLSGVGAPDLLRAFGIEVVQPLAGVGENLRDHYAARVVTRAHAGVDTINPHTRFPRLGLELVNWALGRRNVLGNPPIFLGVQGRSSPGLDNPDYLVTFLPGSFKAGVIGVLDDYPGVTAGGFQLKPRSTGHVRIHSPDAADLPAVQPNYLADPHDQHVIVSAIKMVRRLLFSDAMRPFIESETMPGDAVRTDEDWLDYARHFGVTGYHPVGTAKMGRRDDPMSVVDPGLRVHGLQGLYVVDASVMPDMPASNTYAPTIMIAEKASDMIRRDTR